jgi:hypothetical protein
VGRTHMSLLTELGMIRMENYKHYAPPALGPETIDSVELQFAQAHLYRETSDGT